MNTFGPTSFQRLLMISPDKRLSSVLSMKTSTKLMSNVNFVSLLQKKLPPPFVPNQNVLNCDPTYELEEMIIEAKPLHKKKKRLLRQQTLLTQRPSGDKLSSILEANEEKCSAFPVYNREWKRFQDSLREKETEWERELKQYMDKSNLSDKTVGDKSPKEKLSKDKTTKDNISFDKSSTSP